MAYKRISPLPINEGGTEKTSFTANTVICGGTTTTNPLQNVADTGTTFQILGSQGAGNLPQWITLSNATFFEPLASDPSSPTVGQVFYNTTTKQFKGNLNATSTGWTAKSGLPAAKQFVSCSGIDGSDVLAFGGKLNDGTVLNTCARYTGGTDSWASKAVISPSRFAMGSAGDASDALNFGGFTTTTRSAVTQLYDGGADSWGAGGSLNTARYLLAGGGSSTSALSFGGDDAGALHNVTEHYNGSTWSSKANMNNGRTDLAGAGGAASNVLSFGGINPVVTGITEAYDLTANSWSTKSSMGTARTRLAGSGQSLDCLSFGGQISGGTASAITEEFDSTSNSWSSTASLNTARGFLGGTGSNTDALSVGGFTGVDLNTVERYESSGSTTVVFDITAV